MADKNIVQDSVVNTLGEKRIRSVGKQCSKRHVSKNGNPAVYVQRFYLFLLWAVNTTVIAIKLFGINRLFNIIQKQEKKFGRISVAKDARNVVIKSTGRLLIGTIEKLEQKSVV